MKILFMGTPDFAVPCLEAAVKSGHTVLGVVTQPDKPKGRGHKLTPPPVKDCALQYDIPVYQPENLKNEALLPVLKELKPEIIVVVAYGKILPGYILDFPVYGCVNVHASLLPAYRGAGPIQWCVINGEKKTGVTTMYMAEGLDTGDMILKAETEIGEEETAGELHDRLAVMGAELLTETLRRIQQGDAPREVQDDSLSCYAPMISRETGHIDWSRDAESIRNLVRGTNPWPLCYSLYQGEPMKIIHAFAGGETTAEPGKILSADGRGICVACGDGRELVIDEIQMKGSKRMSVSSYLNGHKVTIGAKLE